MTDHRILEAYGLFSAKVPRYTSYPPANHFTPETGGAHQKPWLEAIPEGADLSIYVHIPFCRRLCWFCACRTQGTSTLRPVDQYVETLLDELAAVRTALPASPRMVRLHLGGGTPTLLSVETMRRLIGAFDATFDKAPGFEFSAEIDPTEAADELLDALIALGMTRASIGVQDFDPLVQAAIGREQSLEETAAVIARLRAGGVTSLNLDLLYGLPHQSAGSLATTLQEVLCLEPDRLALYGYAHVPWMSKRQVLIKDDTLPSARERFGLAEMAREVLTADGYEALGIDHFVRPQDSLAVAARNGTMRRNFQGYTDDPADYLIGLGASAISRFPQGYVQNAVATSAYKNRVGIGRLAGDKGIVLTDEARATGAMIEAILCQGRIDVAAISAAFPRMQDRIVRTVEDLNRWAADVTAMSGEVLVLDPDYMALARILAGRLDGLVRSEGAHSAAV